jgi:ribosomal protein S14
MPKFTELARIASSGEKTLDKRIHMAADGDGDLKVTAWLVHQYMLSQADKGEAPEIDGAEAGAAWVRYTGSLSSVLRQLQLGGGDESAFTSLRRMVGEHLRYFGNAICLRNGRGTQAENMPIWAVRREFREVPAPEELPVFELARGAGNGKRHAAELLAPSPPSPAEEQTTCQFCGIPRAKMMLARHVFREHIDAVELLITAIRNRDGAHVQTTDLAKLMVDTAGPGAVVTTGYVNKFLAGHPQLERGRGFAGDYWYAWASGTEASRKAAPATAAPASALDHIWDPAATISAASQRRPASRGAGTAEPASLKHLAAAPPAEPVTLPAPEHAPLEPYSPAETEMLAPLEAAVPEPPPPPPAENQGRAEAAPMPRSPEGELSSAFASLPALHQLEVAAAALEETARIIHTAVTQLAEEQVTQRESDSTERQAQLAELEELRAWKKRIQDLMS